MAMTLPSLNLPEAPAKPPGPEALAQMVGDLGSQATAVVNTLVSQAKELDDTARKNLREALALVEASLGGLRNELGDLAARLAHGAPTPPPIDAVATLKSLAEGLATAEQWLNREGGLMIAGGAVEVELLVQIPGSASGATARVQFQITPKPIN